MNAAQPALPQGELHVWWCRTENCPASALANLSAQERERHAAFHFDSDRQSYAAAHAMLRVLLAQYGSPHALATFEETEQGKPFARGGIEFNLSHTRGLVACAFSAVSPVGVDVENLQRTNDWERLLSQVQSDEEIAALRALPPSAQQARFYEIWTLKEAWAKAIGAGLHTDFRTLNVLRPAQGLFLQPVETEPEFKAAVACLGAPARPVVRRFEWPAG